MLRAEQAEFSEREDVCFGDVFWHAADPGGQLESVNHGGQQQRRLSGGNSPFR